MTATKEVWIECDHGGRFAGCDAHWGGTAESDDLQHSNRCEGGGMALLGWTRLVP